jgi:hypothetical protein
MTMSGRKPLCHKGIRQIPQRVADFPETRRTVFKTVEGAKVPWRVRFPSASASDPSPELGSGLASWVYQSRLGGKVAAQCAAWQRRSRWVRGNSQGEFLGSSRGELQGVGSQGEFLGSSTLWNSGVWRSRYLVNSSFSSHFPRRRIRAWIGGSA